MTTVSHYVWMGFEADTAYFEHHYLLFHWNVRWAYFFGLGILGIYKVAAEEYKLRWHVLFSPEVLNSLEPLASLFHDDANYHSRYDAQKPDYAYDYSDDDRNR